MSAETVFFEYGDDKFEWHRPKAESNWRKHGVTFEDAATIFGDELALWIDDQEHSDLEQRWILHGLSAAGRLLAVAFVEREDRFRIISARPMTKEEKEAYG